MSRMHEGCVAAEGALRLRHDPRPTRVLRAIRAGAIGGDKNKKISAALAEVVTRHLGVPASRLYIKFYDVARTDFGWNGCESVGARGW